MSTPALKYRFTAFYPDGTSFAQPEDDVSAQFPGKSAFADVDISRLIHFQLHGEGRLAEVNLVDGQIWLDDRMVLPATATTGFQLVYFRRHTVVMAMGVEPTEQQHDVEYHLGWQHPVLGEQKVVLV